MSEFDDIRPYHDDEVEPVLYRAIQDAELIDLIGDLRFGRAYRVFAPLLRVLLRQSLKRRVKSINTVQDFQLLMEKYLARSIRETTSGLQVSGLDKLDLSKSYLFISNHRDITLDPAFTNYALHHNGGGTLRIAIGDNLLSKPFASDLMRLNKSFIVQRSISQPRKLLAALKKLSQYIWHSLNEDHHNIWIAQREGRAKDGWDETEPAIIKMLGIAKPKQLAFADYIRDLRIVPVSIAYEYDPCDVSKAKELAVLAEGRSYVKTEHEDLESIGKGISGYKGQVGLVFGEPLTTGLESAESVAAEIDRAIVLSYQLHASNSYAYFLQCGELAWQQAKTQLASHGLALPAYSQNDSVQLTQRMAQLNASEKELLIAMYANPVAHKIQILEGLG